MSANKVQVGCRYPSGIKLCLSELVDSGDDMRELLGGHREMGKVARGYGEPVTLNGYARRGNPIASDANGKYGVTEVDADFFTTWLEQNADSDLVKNQVVFACAAP